MEQNTRQKMKRKYGIQLGFNYFFVFCTVSISQKNTKENNFSKHEFSFELNLVLVNVIKQVKITSKLQKTIQNNFVSCLQLFLENFFERKKVPSFKQFHSNSTQKVKSSRLNSHFTFNQHQIKEKNLNKSLDCFKLKRQ